MADSSTADVMLSKRRTYCLQKIIEGVVLRMDAKILLEALPPKFEFVISVTISDLQLKIYNKILEVCSNDGIGVLSAFHSLTLTSSHPDIILKKLEASAALQPKNSNVEEEEIEVEDEEDKIARSLIKTIKYQNISQLFPKERIGNTPLDHGKVEDETLKTKLVSESVVFSPKLRIALQIMSHSVSRQEKVVLFSKSLPTLDYIGKMLELLNLKWLRYDGTLTLNAKNNVVQAFVQSSTHLIMLCSTMAAGLGLNLSVASRVILFDNNWNPSNDVQAAVRVFRFGQLKPTYIYRLVTAGTMEEKIYNKQIVKQGLAIEVIDHRNPMRTIRKEDLQWLQVNITKVKQRISSQKFQKVAKDDEVLKQLDAPSIRLICSIRQHNDLLKEDDFVSLTEEEKIVRKKKKKKQKTNSILERTNNSFKFYSRKNKQLIFQTNQKKKKMKVAQLELEGVAVPGEIGTLPPSIRAALNLPPPPTTTTTTSTLSLQTVLSNNPQQNEFLQRDWAKLRRKINVES